MKSLLIGIMLLGSTVGLTAAQLPAYAIQQSPRIPVTAKRVTLTATTPDNVAPGAQWRIVDPDGVELRLPATAEAHQLSGEWTPQQTGFHQIELHDATGNILSQSTIPVVWQNLHLLSWEDPRGCRYVGTSVFLKGSSSEVEYWRKRGSKVLNGIWVRPGNLFGKSDQEVIDFFVSRAKTAHEGGYDGVYIDELGVYPNQNGVQFMRQCALAFAEVKKQFPKLIVHNWTGGPTQREEIGAARDNQHVFMPEIYPEYVAAHFGTQGFAEKLRQRVEHIRNQDGIYNYDSPMATIITLGISGNCGSSDRALIEERIRIIKHIAPETPGICFYYGNLTGADGRDPRTFEHFLDQMSEKYFIRPVLTMLPEDLFCAPADPAKGEPTVVKVMVRNIGGMTAKKVQVNLKFRAADGTVSLIDSRILPELGNGMRRLTGDDFKETGSTMNINGTEYLVAGDKGRKSLFVYTDRAVVEFPWTPQNVGYGELFAEIIPNDKNTVLNGIVRKDIYVK